MELRDYQIDLLRQVDAAFDAGDKAVMLQLATGAGKTAIAAAWAKRKRGVVLFICPTLSVIGQAPREFAKWDIPAIPIGTGYRDWKSAWLRPGMFDGTLQIVACTAISASNRFNKRQYRLESELRHVSAMIVDEAHHAPDSKTRMTSLISLMRRHNIPVLGLTATPWRLSKKQGFQATWDTLVKGKSWQDLRGKYLADVEMYTANSELIAGAGSYSGTDYREGDTTVYNTRNPLFTRGAFTFLDRLARGRKGNLRKTLMYAVGQQHAAALANIALEQGIKVGLLVSDNEVRQAMPDGVETDSQAVTEKLRAGEIELVINVNMVTEGYDCPDVECVICLRPTKSLALWKQICGRGSRISEGKDKLTMIDLTDNHRRLGDPLRDYNWTLAPRGESSDFAEAVLRVCQLRDGQSCGKFNFTAEQACSGCAGEQGTACDTCGKYRHWDHYGEHSTCTACRAARDLETRFDKILRKGERVKVLEIIPKVTHRNDRYYRLILKGNRVVNVFQFQRKIYRAIDRIYSAGEPDIRDTVYPPNVEVIVEQDGKWLKVSWLKEAGDVLRVDVPENPNFARSPLANAVNGQHAP